MSEFNVVNHLAIGQAQFVVSMLFILFFNHADVGRTWFMVSPGLFIYLFFVLSATRPKLPLGYFESCSL